MGEITDTPNQDQENNVKQSNADKVFVEYNGKQVSLSQLSKLTGVKYNTIVARYHRGLRGERLWKKVVRKNELLH